MNRNKYNFLNKNIKDTIPLRTFTKLDKLQKTIGTDFYFGGSIALNHSGMFDKPVGDIDLIIFYDDKFSNHEKNTYISIFESLSLISPLPIMINDYDYYPNNLNLPIHFRFMLDDIKTCVFLTNKKEDIMDWGPNILGSFKVLDPSVVIKYKLKYIESYILKHKTLKYKFNRIEPLKDLLTYNDDMFNKTINTIINNGWDGDVTKLQLSLPPSIEKHLNDVIKYREKILIKC